MKIFSHWLIAVSPFPAYISGFILSLVLFLSYLLIASHSGLMDQTFNNDASSIQLRASLTLMVLVGYLPAAHWYLRKWSHERIGELIESFALHDEPPMLKERMVVPAGVVGCLVFIALFHIIPNPGYYIIQPWNWSLNYAAVIAASSLVGWWMGRLSFELIDTALHLTTMAKRLPKLNLLDTAAFKPFAQQGVQSALLIVILMSITSHLAVNPGKTIVGAIAFMCVMSVLTVIALIFPVRGIHRRLQARKNEELGAIRMQIRSEQEKLCIGSDRDTSRLLALLAMETRIERVSEWPFDVGSISRFLFYLFLGLGSWVGAAVVERLLNSAL